MLKRIAAIFLLMVFAMSIVTAAGPKKDAISPKMKRVVEPTVVKEITGGSNALYKSTSTDVLVDTMQNAYSTQGSYTNQVWMNPATGTLVVVHRGSTLYGSSSGRIHYSFSTDGGTTWYRSPAVNETAVQKNARHPSGFIVPEIGGNPEFPGGMWGELVSGDFGGLGYWTDLEIGGGLATTTLDIDVATTKYSVPDGAFSNGTNLFFGVEDYLNGGYWLMKSEDGGQTWTGADDAVHFANTTDYTGFNGSFGDFAPDGLHGVFVLQAELTGDTVYSYNVYTTEDGGATWTPNGRINESTVTGFPAGSSVLYYQNGVTMDANNNIYIVGTYKDDGANTGKVIMIYGTPGNWAAEVVADVQTYVTYWPGSGGLNSINEANIARSASGDAIVVKWVDGTPTDSTMLTSDLFMRGFKPGVGWIGPAINVSASNDFMMKFTKMANRLSGNGPVYTAHCIWTKFGLGADDSDDLNQSEIFIYNEPIDFTVGISDNNPVVKDFKLGQNYPNPFNPSTNISYTVGKNANVTLKIYNTLGQEVKTLVANKAHTANTYNVSWNGTDNAGNVVSSGIYIYRLEAGDVKLSKKMMFLK